MKTTKSITFLFLILFYQSNAQNSLVLQPYGNMGEDALIWNLAPDSNMVTWPEVKMQAWTWQGTPGLERALIYFNLNLLPVNAIIVSANLALYGNVGSVEAHSTLGGSNDCMINHITTAWNPATVTWNTQPTTDTIHKVILPPSIGLYDDYLNIDVTTLIQDLYNNPLLYKGLMLQLDTEVYYRRLVFKSTDQPDSTRFPTLTINYLVNNISAALSSSDTSFCEKNCIDFFDLSTNNPTSWQWFFPGADSITSNLQNPTNICYNTYGNFDVTLIACDSVGCDTLTFTNFINVYHEPVDSIWISNDTLYSMPFLNYQWYEVGSGVIPGATSQYFVITQPGNYYCVATDSIGCEAISNSILLTGTDKKGENVYIKIQPNPCNGIFKITGNESLNKIYSVNIFNTIGNLVCHFDSTQKEEKQIDVSYLPNGIYSVQLVSNTLTQILKLVVEK